MTQRSSFQLSPKLQLAIRLFLLLLALFNLSRFISSEPLGPNRAVDFRNVYVGAKLLYAGENPYDDDLLKVEWKRIVEQEHISFTTQPGLPVTPLLYPPWALAVFGLFTLLSYQIAYIIWYIMIGICIGLAMYWGGRWALNSRVSGGRWAIDMLLLCFAFKGTVHAWIVGQPSFAVYALLFGALFFDQQGKVWTAGLMLGLAAIKPTLAIPFGLLLLARSRWQTLGFAAACWLMTEAVVVFVQADVIALHQAYLAAASAFRELVFSPEMDNYPIHYIMTHLTELTVWFEYIQQGGHQAYPFLLFMGLIATVALLVWAKKQRFRDQQLLLALLLLSFLINYFSFYDLWILVPFCLIYGKFRQRTQLLIWVLWIPLLIPFHGILDRVALPDTLHFLYLSTPALVLGWLMISMSTSHKN